MTLKSKKNPRTPAKKRVSKKTATKKKTAIKKRAIATKKPVVKKRTATAKKAVAKKTTVKKKPAVKKPIATKKTMPKKLIKKTVVVVEIEANNKSLTGENSIDENPVITGLPVPDKNPRQRKYARNYDKHKIEISSLKKGGPKPSGKKPLW